MASEAITTGGDDSSNNEVTRILESIHDPNGVIDGSFVETAQSLVRDIETQRRALGVPLYDSVALKILLNELYRAGHAFKGRKRMDGSDYFQSHLVGTVKNLILDQGRSGVVTLTSGLWHDGVEDLGVQPKDLVRLDEYGVEDSDLPDSLKDIRRLVARVVIGCTKIRGKSRDETTAATFARFLSIILECGPKPANVKSADRTNNMDTIEGHWNPSKRQAIARETERIYVPLVAILDIQITLRRLVASCMKELNPRLLGEFDRLRDERLTEYMNPYVSEIVAAFKDIRPLLARDVEFNSAPLSNFALRRGKPFEELGLEDLDISPIEPLFEVSVITTPQAQIRDVVAYIVERFANFGTRAEVIFPTDDQRSKRGVIIKIHSQKYGHALVFRVNDSISEARAKRGILANFDDTLPPEVRGEISRILRQTKGGRNTTRGNIVDVARERLLCPTVTVYTPKGKPIHLPKGSTVIDYVVEAYHPSYVTRIISARSSHHIFDTRFLSMNIFDELEDDTVVAVDFDGSDISTDPGWILFCRTEKAEEALRNNCFRKEGENRKTASERGEAYIKKLAALFGVDVESIYDKLIKQQKTGRPAKDQIERRVGQAHDYFEPVRILSDTIFKDQKGWTFVVSLEDRTGELHGFLDEFRRHGINIGSFKHRPPASSEASKKHDIQLSFDSPDELSVFEVLKIFLKLSYRYTLRFGEMGRLQFLRFWLKSTDS